MCDDVPQCQDRSDELGCVKQTGYCDHHCDNKSRCLPAKFLCDGEWDCLDGTDEANCGRIRTTVVSLLHLFCLITSLNVLGVLFCLIAQRIKRQKAWKRKAHLGM